MLGSRAIGSTFITLISLRIFNFLGLLLILLWAVSPIGGQACLRTPGLEKSLEFKPANISYFDWRTASDTDGDLVQSESRPIWTALYTASLAGSQAVKSASQDAYGNVKVPMIETIAGYDKSNSTQWLSIANTTGVEYSSLLGTPTSSQMSTMKTSFQMDSAYMMLVCGKSNVMSRDPAPPSSDWLDTGPSMGLRVATNYAYYRNLSEPRPVWFTGRSHEGFASTICNLTTTYVTLNVSCAEKVCNATEIRTSLPVAGTPPSPTWSVLDQGSSTDRTFFEELVNASMSYTPDEVSGTESYVLQPDNPFNNLNPPDYSKVTPSLFATRYSQLLNTYYACQQAPFAIMGSAVLPYKNSEISRYYDSSNTIGASFQPQQIFVCHQVWLAVQLLASLTMTICALAAAVLTLLRRGPDILGSFSSVTRDSAFMFRSIPSGGSNIDGKDRARHLRRVRVRLGDVTSDQDVGHIALGTIETQEIGPLKRGRLYD